MARTPVWEEWQGPFPDALAALATHQTMLLYVYESHPERVDSLREGLVIELRTSGAIDQAAEARHAVQHATLLFGWHGFVAEDLMPEFCSADGETESDETVDRAIPCVYALVPHSL